MECMVCGTYRSASRVIGLDRIACAHASWTTRERCVCGHAMSVLILHAVGVVVVVVAQGAREGADVLARERIDGDASNIS